MTAVCIGANLLGGRATGGVGSAKVLVVAFVVCGEDSRIEREGVTYIKPIKRKESRYLPQLSVGAG